jgi:hypothetical protein
MNHHVRRQPFLKEIAGVIGASFLAKAAYAETNLVAWNRMIADLEQQVPRLLKESAVPGASVAIDAGDAIRQMTNTDSGLRRQPHLEPRKSLPTRPRASTYQSLSALAAWRRIIRVQRIAIWRRAVGSNHEGRTPAIVRRVTDKALHIALSEPKMFLAESERARVAAPKLGAVNRNVRRTGLDILVTGKFQNN